MENTNLNENAVGEESAKRPQFITILCILTFIGSSLAFIGAIWGYFSIKASASMLESMGSMEGDTYGMMSGMKETMMKAVENAVPNLIIGLLTSLMCLYGALQMWKLKKMGFFIYTAGEITPAITGFLLGGGGIIGGASAVINLLLAIVWIVLYAVNLRHLK